MALKWGEGSMGADGSSPRPQTDRQTDMQGTSRAVLPRQALRQAAGQWQSG